MLHLPSRTPLLTLTLLPAGDEPRGAGCTRDEDCNPAANEVCDVAEHRCEVPCAFAADCPAHKRSPDGDVPSCEGDPGVDTRAWTGEGGSGPACLADERLGAGDGLCHLTCADVAVCYPRESCCANGSLCHSVHALAGCDRVSSLPSLGPDAPLLHDPGQDLIGTSRDLCLETSSCANDGNLCQFSLQLHAPNGDIHASPGALNLRSVAPDGTPHPAIEVLAPAANQLAFRLCFDETVTSLIAAAVLLDQANHQSNSLCFSGAAPRPCPPPSSTSTACASPMSFFSSAPPATAG